MTTNSRNSPSNRTPAFWLAVAIAVAIMLGSGVVFRATAARFARPTESVPIPPGTLAQLPLEIDGWKGRDVPLGERIIKQTDTDQHINRTYSRPGGLGAVSLFVGYGLNMRDLAPHRPEVCYPGAGWIAKEKRVVGLTLEDGSTLPCQIHRFVRGALQNEGVTVLNYYIVDGQWCPDVSLLRSRLWRPKSTASYSAQVQIVCPEHRVRDTSEELVQQFAAASAKAMQALLPQPLEDTKTTLGVP